MLNIFKRTSAKFGTIGPEEMDRLRQEKDHIVLDVRTAGELGEGTIPGYNQINVLHPSFKSKVAELDKSKTYLVYCKAGSRSARACSIMSKLGFEKVYNLSGGIGAWNSYQS